MTIRLSENFRALFYAAHATGAYDAESVDVTVGGQMFERAGHLPRGFRCGGILGCGGSFLFAGGMTISLDHWSLATCPLRLDSSTMAEAARGAHRSLTPGIGQLETGGFATAEANRAKEMLRWVRNDDTTQAARWRLSRFLNHISARLLEADSILAVAVDLLLPIHKDPFDRILVSGNARRDHIADR